PRRAGRPGPAGTAARPAGAARPCARAAGTPPPPRAGRVHGGHCMSQRAPDPVAILAALGLPGATRVVPVLGGEGTVLWRVARADATYALRLFRAGEERKCQREVAAMRVVAAGGVPVPQVHAVGRWEGRPALLLSWCEGQTLVDALTAAPWRVWALGTLFGRVQAPLPRAPPSGPLP